MSTFSKNFQPKTFFGIKETYFSKLFCKINCSAPTRWGFSRVDETGRVLKIKKNTTRKKRPNLFFIFLRGSISGGRTKKKKSFFIIKFFQPVVRADPSFWPLFNGCMRIGALINCFEKYSEKTIFCAIGGTPFPRKMFLFFIKLTNHSIFTILF